MVRKVLIGLAGLAGVLATVAWFTTSSPNQNELRMINIKNAKNYLGVLVGGQPSDEELRHAAKSGYQTIINLRTASEPGSAEEKVLAEKLGLVYVSIPTAGEAGLTRENATALHEALKAASGPVMLHCGSGNRVGGLIALRAHYLLGMPANTALEEGKKAGLTGLEPAVTRILGL